MLFTVNEIESIEFNSEIDIIDCGLQDSIKDLDFNLIIF